MSSTPSICSKCVLRPQDDPHITFRKGVCNHCRKAVKMQNQHRIDQQNLPWIIDQVRKRGEGRKYDAVIGLSGGVDSSYALYIAKQHNLRVFAWHFDNGHNTRTADANVMQLVEGMEVPFYRYRVDRAKFDELYGAFIQAGVKNLEAITDHLLFAINYEMAAKEGVNTILTGGNWQTESVMPAHFGEDPRDLYWIKSIYKHVTGKKLTGLPTIPLWKEQYYRLIKGIKFVPLLEHVPYNRQEAIKRLEQYGYKNPGGKHEESALTKWFQNVYLYHKFGLDKRRPHYASLIHSGQMTRDKALKKLQIEPMQVPDRFHEWQSPEPKTYDDYPNSKFIRQQVMKAYALSKRI